MAAFFETCWFTISTWFVGSAEAKWKRCTRRKPSARIRITPNSTTPNATQGLLRFSDPDPARPFGLHHLLHWESSPAGPREEMLRAASSSARAAFRGSQESSTRRIRPPSAFRGGSHLLLACNSAGSVSSQRSLQRARAVQVKIIPDSSSRRQPALLAQLFRQETREPARAFFGQINHLLPSSPTHRAPQAGTQCWSHPTRQRDRALDGGCRKKCSK